jgi:cellulose synthase (UDP-forming)
VPFLFLAAVTTLGMLADISSFSELSGTDGDSLIIVCTIFDVIVLCIVAAVCVELPKRRRDERFPSNEAATVEYGAESGPCRVRNISLGGAALERPGGWKRKANFGTITLNGIAGAVPFRAIEINKDCTLAIQFRNSDEVRRDLIRKLFTGRYNNEVARVRLGTVARAVIHKLFA